MQKDGVSQQTQYYNWYKDDCRMTPLIPLFLSLGLVEPPKAAQTEVEIFFLSSWISANYFFDTAKPDLWNKQNAFEFEVPSLLYFKGSA